MAFHVIAMRVPRSRIQILVVVFVGALIGLTGCSNSDQPALGEVRGRITLDGKPLPEAKVRFFPIDPVRGALGASDSQGLYELVYIRDLKGAPVGGHSVRITTATETKPEILPAKYHSQTTLTAKVEPGVNEINFDLTSGPAGK
jgi:hypothetical protein